LTDRSIEVYAQDLLSITKWVAVAKQSVQSAFLLQNNKKIVAYNNKIIIACSYNKALTVRNKLISDYTAHNLWYKAHTIFIQTITVYSN